MERLEVTTRSGFTIVLESAGEDKDGNQLWRQVNCTLGKPSKADHEPHSFSANPKPYDWAQAAWNGT